MENYLDYEFVKSVDLDFFTETNRSAADIALHGFVDEDLQRTLCNYELAGYKIDITRHRENITQHSDGTCKVATFVTIKLYKEKKEK